jgi:serine phosphatase RsbU (regulator of sigma subunit)
VANVLRETGSPGAGEARRGLVDQAAGLLAGRAHCRIAEAHHYLLWTADDQGRDVAEVAGRVIRLLDVAEAITDRGPPPSVARLIAAAMTGPLRAGAPEHRSEPWIALVQRVLEATPGMSALLTAQRDAAGRLIDLTWAAASADALADFAGPGVVTNFPELAGLDRWPAYQQVLDTGRPVALGPFLSGTGLLSIRAHRLGPGLLLTWARHDGAAPEAGARRLAEVERQLAEQRRTLDAEHALAARLQQIILPIPADPIELPGLKVALRYLPAGQENLVGGDWYHAAELRDGTVLLAVGDVAGHGTQAATTMAQLRHALRALAVTTSDPGLLLGLLNRLTCELERESPELAATAVIARYDPARQELVWAQAGHPPPLLSRGGRTVALGRPPGAMLGVIDDATYPTARLDFRLGDLLLLYTDGLVEHRRRGLDDGLASVIAALDEANRISPEQQLTQLLGRLRRANPDDDTCILAARPASGETRDLRHHLRAGTH